MPEELNWYLKYEWAKDRGKDCQLTYSDIANKCNRDRTCVGKSFRKSYECHGEDVFLNYIGLVLYVRHVIQRMSPHFGMLFPRY